MFLFSLQVAKKILAGFKAINLTALNFTAQVAQDIEKGVYQFIYIVCNPVELNLFKSRADVIYWTAVI